LNIQEKKNNLPVNEFNQPVKGVSLNKDAWRRLKKNKMALTGLFIVLFYILVAILALIPGFPLYSYKKVILDHQNLPPSLTKTAGELLYEKTEKRLLSSAKAKGRDTFNEEELQELKELRHQIGTETMEENGKTVKLHQRRYFLGTDYLGRDMLARIIFGSQISIGIGLVGTLTAMLIGITIGAIAGYMGGRIDHLLMRFADIMYSLPYMFIVIIIMAFFGKHIFNLYIAIALVSWLMIARIVRGQFISLKNYEFVEAARSMGAGTSRIIIRHMLPNTIGVIIIFTTLSIPGFILAESFLSFLGLGISAPLASWGTLVADAMEGMEHYPWRLFCPGAIMTIFLFAVNFLGDGLRDAFDPQSKNRL
jgi:oligopeptide transport system permease protein